MRLAPLAALALIALAAPAAAQDDAPLGWAMGPALAGVDRDGDGRLTPEEIGATRLPPEADPDGDGLDLAELSAYLFARADADDNGVLSADELRAMRGLAAAGVFRYAF